MKPELRARLYEAGAAVLAVLVTLGVISADQASDYAGLLDKALPLALLVLARVNVSTKKDLT